MGDIFSNIGGAMEGGAGTGPAAQGGGMLGSIGSALNGSQNGAQQPQSFDPNFGLAPRQPTFGEFLQTLLQSIK